MEEPSKDAFTTERPLLAKNGRPQDSVSTRPEREFKCRKFGPFTIPYRASPEFQLLVTSLIALLGPVMSSILQTVAINVVYDGSDEASIVTYICTTVLGVFAGVIVNTSGARVTNFLGSLCYSVYASSYLGYAHTQNTGYFIFASALNGCSSAFFLTAQLTTILSYPAEKYKGRFIAIFMTFRFLGQLGISLGSLSNDIRGVSGFNYSDGVLITFLVLSLVCFGVSWLVVDAKAIVRQNGSLVIAMSRPTWKTEIIGFWEMIGTDVYVLLLLPVFFATGYVWVYAITVIYGSALLTTRAQALNVVLYYVAQMLGYLVTGYTLDYSGIKRSTRARLLWMYLMSLTFAIWGGGYIYEAQKGPDDSTATASGTTDSVDWTSSSYIGQMFLVMFYGFHSASVLTGVYWWMGAMTNNGRKLAYLAGLHMGFQSIGSAIAVNIQLESIYGPHRIMFASSWALAAGSLVVVSPLVFRRVQDTTPIDADLDFTDHAAFGDIAGFKNSGLPQNERELDAQASNVWLES